ncbi:MAG: hypothetical protein WC967_10115 [Balneolaceae bacterium]
MNRLKFIYKRYLFAIAVMAVSIVAFSGLTEKVHAQGMTNINVTGIPTVINTPYTNEFIDNFRNGRYQVIFTYNNSNQQPVDFRFRFGVYQDGKQLLEVESSPQSYQPGAYVFTSVFADLPFPDKLDDILNSLSNKLQNQILQGGTVPEGRYMLKVEAVAEPGNGMIGSMPSITNFVVIYPEAPILINPQDKTIVTQEVPIFNWTAVPISGYMVEYDFLLVEVFENQTPIQAINSNRAHAEERLTAQNTLIYTPAYLPLENGKKYAWRIKAGSSTNDLPIKNNGESPIRTFTYQKGGLLADGGTIENISLIPGFASLKEIDGLDQRDEGNTIVMNGVATLELSGLESQQLPVQVNNLVLQKGNTQNPIVLGGSLETRRGLNNIPIVGEISKIVEINRLRWRHSASAIELNGDIILPNDDRVQTNSWVALTPSGLNGNFIADNVDGVIRVGDDPLELFIERFEASFPGRQLFANGRVELFSGASVCELSQLNVIESESRAIINCPDDASVQLVEGSAQLELLLDNLNGAIDYDFIDNTVSYDLAANGEVTFGLEELTSCSANMQVNLNDETGFSIAQINPTCSIYAPPLDLGFMKLKLSDIDLNSLAYTGEGNWDFDIVLNAALRMPALSNWTLPLSNVQLGPSGLKFPKLEWNKHELGIRNPLDIEGFGIKPISFTMPEFTFPWFSWDSDDVDAERNGDWEFNFDFDFTLPNYSSTSSDDDFKLPSCLVSETIEDLKGTFNKGQFTANIPATVLKECELNLADGYTFKINELGGSLTANTGISNFNLESAVTLDAEVGAGYPFSCDSNTSAKIAKTNLNLDNQGLLTGQINDIVNTCSAELGPLKAQITRSNLVFERSDNTQQIVIEADGELDLGGNQKVEGNLRYNIIKGTFDELNFDHDGLFLLNLPSKEKGVLSFLVKGMSVKKDGILIDGRQEFLIGDDKLIASTFDGHIKATSTSSASVRGRNIASRRNRVQEQSQDIKWPDGVTSLGVTFDKAVIGLTDFEVKSGQIIFDESFALTAEIDESATDVSFSVTQKRGEKSEESTSPNSIYAELGTRVVIDNRGLHTSGKAIAEMEIGTLSLNETIIDFKKNFSMSLNPFQVQQGEADIIHDNRRVAYFNHSGFHLDPAYLTQSIPDTLGLPTVESAYIVLRDQNDNLLVDAQQQADGTFKLSTNAPLDLVIPAIQGSKAMAPKVAVSFTDITYNHGRREVTAGSIQGDFSPAVDLNDFGIPFKVHRVRYDDGFSVNNESFGGDRGLFLEGDLLLYEHQMGESGSVALFLENGERLRGDVDLHSLNANIPLTPSSNFAVLGVDSLKGSINVSLTELETPNIIFDVGGQLKFQNESEVNLAALNYRARYRNGNFIVNAIHQPEEEGSSTPYFAGPIGFSIDKIRTFELSYRSVTNNFEFTSALDFSVLMSFEDGDTLGVPLSNVEITEQGFTIPQQEINQSSDPVLRSTAIALGPTELTLLSFETLRDVSFNWFTGEGIPLAFEMDFDLKLAAFNSNSPAASSATITLANVGYNKGVLTGQIQDYPFQGKGAPISFGGGTQFNLTNVSGGLTNVGTVEAPIQGYDINLAGNLENKNLFKKTGDTCANPTLALKLSGEGGLVGSATNITPCGTLTYGPASIVFDSDSKLDFAFNSNTQSIVLDGAVTAEIEQENQAENITAFGTIKVDVVQGNLIDGEILVNDVFNYGYPSSDPLFAFRVQQAKLNSSGLVISGDAGLTLPNSTDTAKVEFTNFTITPKDNIVADGSFTIQDSVAFEVGVSPIKWKLVDPSSDFTANNTARIFLAGGATVNSSGLTLSGAGSASIRAADELYGSLDVDYQGFQVGFSPTSVQAGQADFTISGESSRFGYLDKDRFHLDVPGLIASVIPDTLGLPNEETAYLVLGDDDGSRYEMNETPSGRVINTLPNKTVELVIPEVRDEAGNSLKVAVAFSATVDMFMNITDGSVSLENSLNLDEFLGIPLILDSLNYSSSTQKLKAAARVKLPSSLNGAVLTTTATIGANGFEQATISAGEYSETYLVSQENVTPIAVDSLGNGAFAFYVRGLELELGQTNSVAFSGQLKSDILVDEEGERTPIHYAANYAGSNWQINIDSGNLGEGIDLGYAKVKPIPSGEQGLFGITMSEEEFALSFSGIVTIPDLLGDDFSLDIEQFKISSIPTADGDYVTINATQNVGDQKFQLINGTLDFTSSNTTVSFADKVLALKTDGTFDFYNQTDIGFSDLEFRSDGNITFGGLSVANLLPEHVELLPDSALVLKDIKLGVENNALQMTALGFAELPSPLNQRADISIKAGTDGTLNVSGPDFIFDDGFTLGNNPETEVGLGDFATLELTGLGLNIDLKNYKRTSLYAAGAVYIENDTEKRLMLGDAGNMAENPGIKYSIENGVEWNVSTNFEEGGSPLAFSYEFFSIDVSSISIETDVLVDGVNVPFQASISGDAGLNINGVGGKANFSGFKFSTLGVDEIGRLDGGASFTLMDIVTLELGSFDYKTAGKGNTFTLEFEENSGSGSKASVTTVEIKDVEKYLHFKPASGSEGNALKISLSEGISGGIGEVLYYQTSGGERYLRIKDASLELHDQASITVGMEYIQQSDGFALSVAGGGHFSSVGIAAAGSISTINDDLRFGIFVAVSAPINFLGIIEMSSIGGGFYYRPTQANLDMTVDAIKAMDDSFKLNGSSPNVENLKFAILLYANISIGGSGDNAAISANALVQITDQFTKIDANGMVFNQGDRFSAGMYLTILYTPDITGVEGGFTLDIHYDPVLEGSSKVDFFAKSERSTDSAGNDNSSVMWGITGNFKLEVLPALNMLSVAGEVIVSSDGLLLELGASSGFDVAVVAGNASFNLLVWYLPKHTDPLGIYGKFSIGFSIIGGLAKFNASVEGGYFDRGNYIMIYFAGEAHVEVLFVINATVRGWAKFQTKSPRFDYGRGGNSELDQMIADAKDAAEETKRQAEETKNSLDEAKESLDDALAIQTFEGFSGEELQTAGFNLVSGLYSSDLGIINKVSKVMSSNPFGERRVNSAQFASYSFLEWIMDNVMFGMSRKFILPTGYTNSRVRPLLTELSDYESTWETQLNNKAPDVNARLDEAISALGDISSRMEATLSDLDEGDLTLQNPVSSITGAISTENGELLSEPSFNIDEGIDNSNKSQLEAVENQIQQMNQHYQDAIRAGVDNINLVDLVLDGNVSISWGAGTTNLIASSSDVSVNRIASLYENAILAIGGFNTRSLASYWSLAEWAQTRISLLNILKPAITNYSKINNHVFNTGGTEAAKYAFLAQHREDAIVALAGLDPKTDRIGNFLIQEDPRNSENRKAAYQQNTMDFWYNMPKLGLEKLEEKALAPIDGMISFIDQKKNELESKHLAFTKNVEQLYTIKSNMLTTVYGMIESYNGWANEGIDGSEVAELAPFSNKLNEIEVSLTPPSIDYISGKAVDATSHSYIFPKRDNEYRGFYGTANIEYKASHPVRVSEVSYSFTKGQISSVYAINNYYTSGYKSFRNGNSQSDNLYNYYAKQSQDHKEVKLTGAIRARSPGGVTSSRLVNFTVPVSPTSSFSSQPVTVTYGDDTTPPSTPVVASEYLDSGDGYWVADSTKLEFTISSVDQESGISLFKYKIGTTPDASNVRDWTDAQGSRSVNEKSFTMYVMNIFGGVSAVEVLSHSSQMEATIRGLNLQKDVDYYISFKTVNGDGVDSNVRALSKPFRFDPTPPSETEITVRIPNVRGQSGGEQIPQRQVAPANPVIQQAIYQDPRWNQTRVNEDQSSVDSYKLSFSWASEDAESGIKGFSVGSARTPNASVTQVFREGDIDFIPITTTTELIMTPPFQSDLYMYFKARNNADMESTTKIFGPVQNIDTSVPTTPEVKVKSGTSGFTIYITQLSDDAQSGIKGYQYALISADGTDTLRTWPELDEVDIAEARHTKNRNVPANLFVPASSIITDGSYKVAVRAINNQEMASRVVVNENVIIDRSSPTKTLGTATYSKNSIIKVDFSQVGSDPESGIELVSYKIIKSSGLNTGSSLITQGLQRARKNPSQESTTTIEPCRPNSGSTNTFFGGGISLVNSTQNLEDDISSPSTTKPFFINLAQNSDDYAALHPCLLDEKSESKSKDKTDGTLTLVEMINQGYIPKLVITTRNKVGLETTSEIRIKIPNNLHGEYTEMLRNFMSPDKGSSKNSKGKRGR